MNEIICVDFNDYQQRAVLTLNRKTETENILHAIMGMSGESGEFHELPFEKRDNKIGEIGDCMWYSAVLANEMGLKFEWVVSEAVIKKATVNEFSSYASGVQAMLWSCRLIDLIKKTVFYGKEIDKTKLGKYLVSYVSALLGMAELMDVLLLDCGSINIRKLAARYPDLKFDAVRAINRDYAVESKAAGVEIV